jgi:hypothetical protein
MRAGKHLAVVCLFCGAAVAAFVSGSLEQRIGNLFCFGLIPAVGFYAGGHILGQLLVFGVELCDMIMARCSRYAVRLANDLLSWAGTDVSNWVDRGCPHQAKPAELTHGALFGPKQPNSHCAQLIISNPRYHTHPGHDSPLGGPNGDEFRPDVRRSSWRLWSLIIMSVSLIAVGFGWLGVSGFYWPPDSQREEPTTAAAVHAVVEQIIRVESDGDPNAKNKRSSATGLGQFLDETWLDMIRAHRPDLAKGRSKAEILELRRDAKIARDITARFTERNAEMLRKRGLPVTPGTLYLAHFAGGAGAVVILSAIENADAALVMATADATGRTTREKIIRANPFLERFTVADLRSWADRKMHVPGL